MKLLILILLIDAYILKKYEKGNEGITLILTSIFLIIIYYVPYLSIFTKPIRILIEITLPSFLFFQFFLPSIFQIKESDYLVVLGCGLLDGVRISPLLMKRCDVAIDLYHSNNKKIIVSGGKGSDERVSEAMAMKEYLIMQGIKGEDILCEDKSKTTKENLMYTSELIGDEFTIVTSDYHQFRVFLLSKQLRLNTSIHISKTKSYYRIYAIAREYFALLYMGKAAIILLYFLLFIFQ